MKQCFLFVFLCLILSPAYSQKEGQALIDSLLEELPKAKEDTNKVHLLRRLSLSLAQPYPQEAMKYANTQLELAQKLDFQYGIANSHYNIGNAYLCQNDLAHAFENYNTSMKLYEEIVQSKNDMRAKKGVADCYLLMGTAYQNQANYPKALEYSVIALKMYEEQFKESADPKLLSNLGNTLGNIGMIYYYQSDYTGALPFLKRALELREKSGNKTGLAATLTQLGNQYSGLKDTETALTYFLRALRINEELNNPYMVFQQLNNIANIYKQRSEYALSLDYYKSALANARQRQHKSHSAFLYWNLAELYLQVATDSISDFKNEIFGGSRTRILEEAKMHVDSAILINTGIGNLVELHEQYWLLGDIEAELGRPLVALQLYKTGVIWKDSLFTLEKDKKLTQTVMQYEFDKKEAAGKAAQDKKDTAQRNIRNAIIASLAGALLFLIVVYRQRNKISKARKRSDELLLNILPYEVAEELKEKGSAGAKQFDEVTVMFTDFKDFSQISEKLSPAELVNEIHSFFKAFDDIITKHNIEKIKTIGDAYMCAGGLPTKNETHARDVVSAALEIQQFMQEHLLERKKQNKDIFEIRIGIHTGPVVAGIVGVKKFAYDIWGDTVNIAARMESSGEADQINISGMTYELVKEHFDCTYRGRIPAKNKGDIDMYFVNHSLS